MRPPNCVVAANSSLMWTALLSPETAAKGTMSASVIALEKVASLVPDLVTLDITNIHDPRLVHTLPLEECHNVYLARTYAYIAGGAEGLVVVDITTPLEQRRSLGDNFRVEARVITWESANALKLPSSGLFRQGNDWAAFVVRGGEAKLVPVKTGRSSGAETQIVEGLQEGDEVILYPGDRIKAGQRVKPTKV